MAGASGKPGRDCPLCPRLHAFRDEWRSREPQWFNAPVPSFGSLAARLLIVGLAPGLAGYVVPSRLYGILAVARPVIVAADAESETAQVVERIGCGIVVPPGRPELLARAIRDAHDGKYDLIEMGKRGREWVEREADRSVALRRYRDLLGELAPS